MAYTSLINASLSGSSSSINSATISSFNASKLISRCCLSKVSTVSFKPLASVNDLTFSTSASSLSTGINACFPVEYNL